ncbi:leucine-rich repeat domain-containing protein [Spongiimicrobium salis]|uniref:leucine-rich repeat domain-containing protein n=1 Tax=Spongiimicrobium salis TaxID=1667022 RepID=UPI00374DBBB4
MRGRLLNLWTMLFLILLTACSKDDGNIVEEPTKSSAKQITALVFKSDVNTVLTMDVRASVNETAKRISAIMPFGTDISALKPEITISEKATVSNASVNDFTEVVKITVTAEDGSTVVYDVIISIAPNNANAILSFAFSLTENPISLTIVGQIDEENKIIIFETPLGTDISSLLPQIQASEGSSFSPQGRQDFKEPVIYTVTAQDGSTTEYTVIWEISQRDILLTLYNQNPENTLDWDLENTDISTWEGVTTDGMGNVIALNFVRKDLQNLPEVIGRLSELSTLNLESNSIREIPRSIQNLTKLTDFSLEGNQIAELPMEIGLLNSLDRFFLSFNLLEEIPTEIGELTNLRSLDVSHNMLRSLPSELGKLSNLTFLKINRNQMTDLPSELDQLQLRGIDLSDNKFERIPSSIFRMPNLEFLRITFCPLKSLPPAIGQAKKLETLRIEYTTEILSLPIEIGGLESLKNLTIQNTRLANLPASIGELSNLEVLAITQVGLSALPSEIGNLKNLKALDVTGGSLSSLPAEIGLLSNLEELYLNNNELTDIPESIGNLENLFALGLRFNQISGTLPTRITELTKLSYLDLHQNSIDKIPTEISRLTQLETLIFHGNDLKTVPQEMGLLTSLIHLSLEDNPNLVTIPQAICDLRDTGTRVVLDPITTCQ